ncbi:Npun_F5560 family protein [Acaryochloris sp. IP29b_bin.137]|uniref:Npun_F5560 family protein n=1 Tax=Acaryochloris sp. IP29b_bin.137 TaxID=2969217 RepID=UPI0026318978|nr:Npun_F5560 family protein [Acaryochloris sp. IP29b_bin.137]
MNYSQPHMSEDVQTEILQLSEQLQLRDQLVEQLSTELYRIIKANPAALPPAQGTTAEQAGSSLPTPSIPDGNLLHQDMTTLESQIEFYQAQIDKRDAQITHLQSSCQSLSERNQMLERVIQELPEVYRQKFAQRLDQVKTKMKFLQLENRRLYSALQDSNPPQLNDASNETRMSLPAQNKPSRESTT